MSYSNLPALSHEIATESRSVALHAAQLGLDSEQFSALKSIVKWQTLLTSDGPEPRESLQTYMRVLGYLPEDRRILANAERSPGKIEACADSMTAHFTSGRLTVEEFIRKQPLEVKLDFPQLNKSQIKLLQSIMQQEMQLDTLQVSGLASQFPFPITQGNFFGRFLAGGCDEPQKAARHLQISTPYFIRLRSVLEGLSNPKKNYLVVNVTSAEEQAEAAARSQGSPVVVKKATAAQRDNTEVYDILVACINNSSDFSAGGNSNTIAGPMVALQVPRLPDCNIAQFEKPQKTELAVALFDWLLFGKKTSELLQQKKLPVASEKRDESNIQALKKAESALRRLLPKQPDETAPPYQVRRWEKRQNDLEMEISSLKNQIRDTAAERSAVKPLIRLLESDESTLNGIRTFRKELASAQEKGARIVLSLLKTPGFHSYAESPFLALLDRAATTRRFQSSPAVQLLKNTPLLLSPAAEKQINQNRVSGFASVTDQRMRTFTLDRDELTPSLRYLISGILPEKIDPDIRLLMTGLVEHFELPGVSSPDELRYVVREASGKRNPGAAEYLEYAFERTTQLNRAQFHVMLETLRQLGINEIPDRCVELAEQRFRLPPSLISQFEVYSRRYTPQKLGEAPTLFEDLATFERYTSLKLDASGMAKEVLEIENHLRHTGVVAVVDGTNYHPELRTAIGATGDVLEAGDTEKTSEIWGDYVRPSERVIRALTLRLIEGGVDQSLKNHSLLGVRKPEKAAQIFQKLIKKMYGLEIDIAPDLSQINQVLADLSVHDDRSILVLDAQQVNNLQQYREFIDLLSQYQLKIIVRCREPIPGIPQVNIQPFLEHEITDRLFKERESLAARLGLNNPVTTELLDFTVAEVRRNRSPGADPLNLVLQLLDGAANHARHFPDKTITEQDVVAASAAIFHRPDGTQMRLRLDAINSFAERAPQQVLGQEKPIKTVGDRMCSHILGMRDPIRPLTLLLPGPTGVGKTELMIKFAQACDIPFFMIEGAEFSEQHTVSRLVGSPSGYQGPDEGILFRFLKTNTVGLVFIDEIEKMHPGVYQALMNFFDKATLTSGEGETVSRPGFIIVGASNAGAERLHRNMSQVEVREILAESFVDRFGRPRPELVRRFEPVPMLAIERSGFDKILRANLGSIGNRPGFIGANLRLVDIDEKAVSLLYTASRQVCEFNEQALSGTGEFGFASLLQQKDDTGLFYDMRHVSRALDDLAGESLQRIAIEQYDSGNHARRGAPRAVQLVGVGSGKTASIELRDAVDSSRNGPGQPPVPRGAANEPDRNRIT